MLEIFQYSFMLRAFAAGIMIAIIAPLIGQFLVMRKFSLIADTLSHVALAGVAIALLTRTQPLITTVIVTSIAAIVIEKIRLSQKLSGETILAMFLPGGLAVSVILMSLANGLNTNLFSYLFGSITTVKSEELWLIFGLGLLTIGVVAKLYKWLLYAAFDEETAKASGVPVSFTNTILLILTAITVSLAMRVVGVLLIGALMVIPVVSAMQTGKSFLQNLWLSIGYAIFSVCGGLFLSYYLNLPAGGTIVLLSLLIFILTTVLKQK